MLDAFAALLADALGLLLGRGGRADLLQDYIGARGLISGGDAYPILGPAMGQLGVSWPLTTYSTHPPTAFLFLVPLAGLPWSTAAQVWAALMLVCLGMTAWAFGLRVRTALLLSPSVIWPPVIGSLGQLTPVWLVALALAWRFRQRPFWAGVCIGIASLPKLLPVVGLVPFVRERSWGALLGFGVVWATALATIAALDPRALVDYMLLGRSASDLTVLRLDNGALLPFTLQQGPLLAALAVLLVAAMAVAALARPLDQKRWLVWNWIGVALLPIAWTYSLLPLLPGLLVTMREGRLPTRILAAATFLLPFLAPLPSQNPLVVAPGHRPLGRSAAARRPG
jgi:Glycosyltransferase family 87